MQLIDIFKVGQEWINTSSDDLERITITSIDPDTMYPILYQWHDYHKTEGRDDIRSFLRDFTPDDLEIFITEIIKD